MKILVPTDFSMYADYAIDAAIKIGKHMDAEIHLYHSADLPDDWEDLPSEIRYKDTFNKPRAIWVRNKLNGIRAEIETHGLSSEIHYTVGKFVQNIREITDKIDFDLIIMGSHGISGKEEWFVGSNTQKVIRKLHHKVLVIKEDIQKVCFDEVLFVTGLFEDDKEAFKRFLYFVKPFNPRTIHVMSVDTTSFFSQPSNVMHAALKDFEAIAEDSNIETHFYKDYSIVTGVTKFADENNIDLIAISNQVRHPLKRVFSGSNVEMLINRAHVPLLSIDYKI